jgi:hypothetical protein
MSSPCLLIGRHLTRTSGTVLLIGVAASSTFHSGHQEAEALEAAGLSE